MSYTYIKLNGTLSDALYQACSAFGVSFHTGKKLGISIEDIDICNVIIFNKIKKFSILNCPNEFYEEHMSADSLITQIPNCKRNIQMFGAFKNKDHFFEYRKQLYNQYHFEIIPELENSTYVYIDDTFLENNKYFIEILNELLRDNKQVQIVIHSSEYSSIRERLEEIYMDISYITFLDNVSDYEKLCVMISCREGGYSTGKELGFWAEFLQENEEIIGFNTVCESNKWDCVDKIMYIKLKESSYRKKYMEKLLHDIPNEKIICFDAIKDTKGYIGYIESHIECLTLAKKNNWKNVMIIEDDIKLGKQAKEAMETLHTLLNQPYDVILLGSAYTKINRETYKLYEGQRTSGYIVANHYFDILLNNFKEGLYNLLKTDIYSDFSIDQYWKRLQEIDNWYFCYPGLIIQKPSYSMIEKKYLDYAKDFDNITFVDDIELSINNDNFDLYIKLIGGFGNQLFMIFNLIALSKKYNKKIKFYYDDKYINSYLKERNTLRKSSSNYEIFKNIDFTKLDESLLTSFNTYSELEYKYNEIILETDKKYSIQGYFQSYKYFWEYKDEIKEYLCIDSDKIKEIKKYFSLYEKPILSIHMRLGDYLQSPDFHSIPSIEYFKNALANYNLDEYQIILFSDDIEAASEKIKELNISFIKADELYKSDEEQFYMLCLSKIRICSNSTYSLMSCYLNDMYNFVENPEYTFPHKWFARLGPSYHIHDLIPVDNDRYKILYTKEENFNESLIDKYKYINNLNYISFIKNNYTVSSYPEYNLPTVCVYINNYHSNKIYYNNCISRFNVNKYHFIFFIEGDNNIQKLLSLTPNYSLNTINEKSISQLLLISKCDHFIISDSHYALFAMYLSYDDINFCDKKKYIPFYWNNNIDIFTLCKIDFNTTIIDNRNNTLISKKINHNLQINYYNNYEYENTLFYIAKTETGYFKVNNLSKTKFPIDIQYYIEECTKIINYLNIYNVSEIELEKFRIEENDIFFTVFVIGYNCNKWIKTCIESILNQVYSNFELIYLNPESTDNTVQIVNECCQNQKSSVKYYIVDNKPRKYQSENFFTITKLAKENSILVSVDGDDWLKHIDVLKEVNMTYFATNCLLTHGLYEEVPLRYVDWHWKEIPNEILNSNTIRESNMRTSHLRTWLRELLLYVNEDDTKFENKFQKVCGDLSILYPMIEIAGNRIAYIKKENYCYNTTNQNSDFKTNIQLQEFLDEYYRKNANKYKKVDNVWYLINYYLRNIKHDNLQILQKYHLSKYLRPSNLKLALLDQSNKNNMTQIYNEFNKIRSSIIKDDVYVQHSDKLFNLFYDIYMYDKVRNIDLLNKNILNLNLNVNMFETNYILNSVKTHYIFDTNKSYDWNIIIPYYNRYENMLTVLQNIKDKIGDKIKYIITIVEISETETLINNYTDNFNYIWIDSNKTNCFNKSLCANITYKLYENKYKYDSILWHDVDCCIQSNFIDMINNKLNGREICIQTFPFTYVIYTHEKLANKIRSNIVNVDDITEKTDQINKVSPGAPGGSILIPKSIFENQIYFNTSVFYNYCCEDSFIKYNIEKYSKFENVDYKNNHMIHLWHPTFGLDPIINNKHFYFQENFLKLYKQYN